MTTSDNSHGLSRRQLLGSAVATAGLAAAGATVGATPAGAATRSARTTTPNAVLHLLRRATYGPTPALVAEVMRVGTAKWLDAQLRPETVADTRMDSLAKRWPLLERSIGGVRASLDNGAWDAMEQFVQLHIARAAWSRRQVLEVMVDFWSNHLNVTVPSSEVWDSRHRYDKDVIRRHALGKFSDMLVASAQHPSMLHYLDNADSSKDSPNENYGRELLELHTVGMRAGYTEDDVWNSTLIMTGFGVDWRTGEFVYDAKRHHVGPVKVLGFSSANASGEGGYDVALAYLRYLATHPATARTIARRLCVRFVSDSPPPALVERLAKLYLASDTAIAPVLRALFTSREFGASRGTKVRTPFEDLVATIRILGIAPDRAGVEGVKGLRWMAQTMGQSPLAWSLPDGYPDVAASWASASGSLSRWNAHMSLAAGWWPNTLTNSKGRALLPRRRPATHGALVDALCRRLLIPPSGAARGAVCAFLGKRPSSRLRAQDEALTWRLPYIVALLLDSPAFATR